MRCFNVHVQTFGLVVVYVWFTGRNHLQYGGA